MSKTGHLKIQPTKFLPLTGPLGDRAPKLEIQEPPLLGGDFVIVSVSAFHCSHIDMYTMAFEVIAECPVDSELTPTATNTDKHTVTVTTDTCGLYQICYPTCHNNVCLPVVGTNGVVLR